MVQIYLLLILPTLGSMVLIEYIAGMSVVYFDQQMGASHAIYWSK